MIRPPVPPVYFFLIDVSVQNIQNKMVETACMVIKNIIDNDLLPDRT